MPPLSDFEALRLLVGVFIDQLFNVHSRKARSLLSDSNQRPLDYKSSALPTELKRRLFSQYGITVRDTSDEKRVQRYNIFFIRANYFRKNRPPVSDFDKSAILCLHFSARGIYSDLISRVKYALTPPCLQLAPALHMGRGYLFFGRRCKDTTKNGDLQVFVSADAANTAFLDFMRKSYLTSCPWAVLVLVAIICILRRISSESIT